MSPAGSPYRLIGTVPPPADRPGLDVHQRAVVAHRGGPLLVLAGPGTGKTTTLVEAVAHRVTVRGIPPERILVLTFSRTAAVGLAERLAVRLGRTTTGPMAATFHSFCHTLLRDRQPVELYGRPPRILSGPEQDVVVRDLLEGGLELGTVTWPGALRAALRTRGFTEEIRAVLARARGLGLEPAQLALAAKAGGRPDWSAAAAFFAEYLDVLDAQGLLDYPELVHRAVLLARTTRVGQELRRRYAAVFVDEYQDTDPAQVRLLHALAGGGRDLVVFGDPDQSIYAFRGADSGGILDFRTTFRKADGSPADVRVLRVSRRAGPDLLAVSRLVAQRIPLARLPAADARAHRTPVAVEAVEPATAVSGTAGAPRTAESAQEGPVPAPPARAQVFTFPTPGAELDAVADLLRRAHLEDGVAWSDMAVLVRSGIHMLPRMRRVLAAAGVPVAVDGDELPVAEHPAAAVLLLALRCAADPGALTVEVARTLLLSPLAGLDTGDLRRLGRVLRVAELTAVTAADPLAGPETAGQPCGEAPGTRCTPRSSAALIREALADGAPALTGVEETLAGPVRRLSGLIRLAREHLRHGRIDQALWELWTGTGWPARLERAAVTARGGGPAGGNAGRDLDGVCVLFETVARAQERAGHVDALSFVDQLQRQEIAGNSLAPQGRRDAAVRLLTAHRAKGLEWPLVVVVGVQEGVWPDLRRRGLLLEADRIGTADGPVEPVGAAALLAEERRLFYVAVTRASRRLVVTAVASPADDGDQPSRFLGELGVPPVTVHERPRRPLSVPGLVAELRSVLVDPATSEPLRQAASTRLAVLAAARDAHDHLVAPAAHPVRWWGLLEPTDPQVPMRDPAEPVLLAGSALRDMGDCPLRWFLRREARAESVRTVALGFGSVLHALADDVASGRTPPDPAVLTERLETVWSRLDFEAPWRSQQEKTAAQQALGRFLAWHAERGDRHTVAASEHPFQVRLAAGGTEVVLRGTMDRIEATADGRAYIVDFKTGRHQPPGAAAVQADAQLGVYQLAVRHGAVDDLGAFGGRRPECEGAALVQLRHDANRSATPEQPHGTPVEQIQSPPATGEDGRTWVEVQLADAAERIRAERFAPTRCDGCVRCEFRRCCPIQDQGRPVVD